MRGRRVAIAAFGVPLAYFVLAILARAIDRASSLSSSELTLLGAGQLELTLGWRASLGQWVGFDVASARGPLWQLLIFLGALGAERDPWRVSFAMHAILPLLSLACVVVVARLVRAPTKARALLLVVLALLVLHLALDALVPALGLVALVLSRPDPDQTTRAAVRRGLASGLVWMIAVLLDPSAIAWALPAIAVLAVLSPSIARGRVALAGIGASLGVLALGVGALTLASAATGGIGAQWLLEPLSDLAQRRGEWLPHAASPIPGLIFVAASVGAVALALRHDREDTVVWAATLPALAIGLMRGTPEAIYLGSIPGVAALASIAVGAWPRSRLASGVAALLVVVFLLGWLPHYDRRTAWLPSALRDGAIALEGGRPAPRDDDFAVAVQTLRSLDPAGSGCAVVSESLAAAPMIAGVPGPFDPMRESTGDGANIASQLRNSSCQWALTQLHLVAPFSDDTGWVFGLDQVALAERYAPERRVGSSLVLARWRERPVPARVVPLAVQDMPRVHHLTADSPLVLRFERAVPADHLVRLDLRLDANELEALLGRLPRIRARFFLGDRPLRSALLLPMRGVGQEEPLLVPVDAERVEHRWVAGVAVADGLAADRVVLTLERPPGSGVSLDVRVARAYELAPGALAEPEPEASECRSSLDVAGLAERVVARHTRAEIVDGVLSLDPSPNVRAEIVVPITPCADACLVGLVGLEGDAGEVRFEADVLDGPLTTSMSERRLGPGFRQPFEIPLGRWASRPVLLRLATAVGDRAPYPARIYEPHVRPCASLFSVVHALFEGHFRAVRGSPSVVGDTLRLPLVPLGQPPTEVRVPLRVPDHACLAVEVRGAELEAPAWVVVGIVSDGRLTRMVREIVSPDDPYPERDAADLSLAAWQGRNVELYFAAWSNAAPHGGRMEVMRPRIHRCGEPADWAF